MQRPNPARWIVALLLVGSFVGTAAQASPVVGFRGDGTGVYPGATPPLHWSPTRNVVWSTRLPSGSNASPVLVRGRLFVCAEPTTLLAVDASDGRILWQRTVTRIDTLPPAEQAAARAELAGAEKIGEQLRTVQAEYATLKREVRRSNVAAEVQGRLAAINVELARLRSEYAKTSQYRPPTDYAVIGNATPTPVSDGEAVYALFGNSVAASFTLDGQLRWARWLGEQQRPMNGYEGGIAASPLLADDRLIVTAGKLRALDTRTGAVVWEGRNYPDFGTPALARLSDGFAVMTPQGDVHRTSDGRRLASNLHGVYYLGPTVVDRTAFFVGSAGDIEMVRIGTATAAAFELPERSDGTVKPLWNTQLRQIRFYSSPTVLGDRIYACDHEGGLFVLDRKTGQQLDRRQLDLAKGPVYSSLTVAGRHLFVTNEAGRTIVLELPSLEEVARNELEVTRSTPLFSGRRMYLRGQDRLWCIEESRTTGKSSAK